MGSAGEVQPVPGLLAAPTNPGAKTPPLERNSIFHLGSKPHFRPSQAWLVLPRADVRFRQSAWLPKSKPKRAARRTGRSEFCCHREPISDVRSPQAAYRQARGATSPAAALIICCRRRALGSHLWASNRRPLFRYSLSAGCLPKLDRPRGCLLPSRRIGEVMLIHREKYPEDRNSTT